MTSFLVKKKVFWQWSHSYDGVINSRQN